MVLGVRDRISPHLSLSLAPALPVLRDVNGEQVETEWRVGVSLVVTP